jgi:hypothetical protein
MPQIMVDGAHIRGHVGQRHPQAYPIASTVSTSTVGSSVRLSARHLRPPSYRWLPLALMHRRDRLGEHLVAAFAYGPATSRRPRRLTMGQTSKVACRWPWITGSV